MLMVRCLFLLCRRLDDVLVDKYKWSREDAATMATFILPMLEFFPHNRATATASLKHPWLADVDLKT